MYRLEELGGSAWRKLKTSRKKFRKEQVVFLLFSGFLCKCQHKHVHFRLFKRVQI